LGVIVLLQMIECEKAGFVNKRGGMLH